MTTAELASKQFFSLSFENYYSSAATAT